MQGLTVVFDLDGTLVDTAPDLVDATNHALAARGLPGVPEAGLRPWISFGARRMVVEALARHRQSAEPEEIDELHGVFLSYYESNIANRSRPYEGVVDALETLSAEGAICAVCTNKRAALSHRLLDALDLSRHFRAVAGRDTFPVCKPDPAHLTGAIEMAAGKKARAVMIGDSMTDVATAKAAGIPVIAVSFGYTDIPASRFGADRVIERYERLPQAIRDVSGSPITTDGGE